MPSSVGGQGPLLDGRVCRTQWKPRGGKGEQVTGTDLAGYGTRMAFLRKGEQEGALPELLGGREEARHARSVTVVVSLLPPSFGEAQESWILDASPERWPPLTRVLWPGP